MAIAAIAANANMIQGSPTGEPGAGGVSGRSTKPFLLFVILDGLEPLSLSLGGVSLNGSYTVPW